MEKRKKPFKPRTNREENLIRLNKYIADAGICSRRKADELISSGVVKINKKTVTELGTMVQRGSLVTVSGNPIQETQHLKYIVLNKPKDIITTSSDEKGRATVMDIVRMRTRIYPVGRLDRNTTGVLLLTNDGELANRLTHPSYQIERTYSVGLDRSLKSEDAKIISKGMELEDGKMAPCEVYILPDDSTKAILIMNEGKNREIRRIFEALDYGVKKLDRKSFAGISAAGLARGEYRHLTFKEVNALRKLVGLR
jgi:23S rRNA pseudouridine2605 synthase